MSRSFRLVVPTFLGTGCFAAIILWFTIPDPTVVVNVRWRIDIPDTRRTTLEQQFHLTQGRSTEGTTRQYTLTDYSYANIRALVEHSEIEDTYRLNRTLFEPVEVPISRNAQIARGALIAATAGSMLLLCARVLAGPIWWASGTLGTTLRRRIVDWTLRRDGQAPVLAFERYIWDALWVVMLNVVLLGIYTRTIYSRQTGTALLTLFGPPITFVALLLADRLVNRHYERLSRVHAWLGTRPAGIVFITAGLTAFALFAYRGAFQHTLPNRAEIELLNFVHDRSFLGSVAEIRYQPYYFRPLPQISAYALYHLFGLNHPAYVGAELFILGLSAGVLAFVLYRISGDLIISTALSLLFTVHVFVSRVIAEWPIDDVTAFLGLLGALVMYLTAFGRSSRSHVAILFSVLLLSFLSKESGLALGAGAAGAVLVDAVVSRERDMKQLAWWLSGFAALLAIYFGLRWIPSGQALPPRFITDTCLGTELYTASEIMNLPENRQLLMAAYTLLANLTAEAAPALYGNVGCMNISGEMIQDWAWPVLFSVVGFAAYQVALQFAKDKYGRSVGTVSVARTVTLSILLCTVAPVMLLWVGRSPVRFESTQAMLVLHTFVSAIVVILLFQLKHDRTTRLVIGFCAGVLLSTPVLAFSYFRYRNFYLPLMAWLALTALCFRQTRNRSGARNYLLSTARIFVAAMIVMSTVLVGEDLPRASLTPQYFDSTNVLCARRISNDLALQIGRQAGIEDKVAQCREANLQRRR